MPELVALADPVAPARAARWYRSDSCVELKQWADVLPHLSLPVSETAELVAALVQFAHQVSDLPATMREAGVDADIVDFLLPSIANQVTQLSALQS